MAARIAEARKPHRPNRPQDSGAKAADPLVLASERVWARRYFDDLDAREPFWGHFWMHPDSSIGRVRGEQLAAWRKARREFATTGDWDAYARMCSAASLALPELSGPARRQAGSFGRRYMAGMLGMPSAARIAAARRDARVERACERIAAAVVYLAMAAALGMIIWLLVLCCEVIL